jgi:hypothetical protein
MDEEAKRKDRIMSIALGEGIKYGVVGFCVAGVGTLAATLRYPNFKRFMSVSAKASLPVMSGIGLFGYKFEIVMHDAMLHPENWGLAEYIKTGKVSTLPIHHKVLNALYDNPFTLVAGLGVPFAATVLSQQLKLKHLTLSQKIMQTRVYAQGGIIAILLVVMMFREYMNAHGRFPEPGDENEEDEE